MNPSLVKLSLQIQPQTLYKTFTKGPLRMSLVKTAKFNLPKCTLKQKTTYFNFKTSSQYIFSSHTSSALEDIYNENIQLIESTERIRIYLPTHSEIVLNESIRPVYEGLFECAGDADTEVAGEDALQEYFETVKSLFYEPINDDEIVANNNGLLPNWDYHQLLRTFKSLMGESSPGLINTQNTKMSDSDRSRFTKHILAKLSEDGVDVKYNYKSLYSKTEVVENKKESKDEAMRSNIDEQCHKLLREFWKKISQDPPKIPQLQHLAVPESNLQEFKNIVNACMFMRGYAAKVLERECAIMFEIEWLRDVANMEIKSAGIRNEETVIVFGCDIYCIDSFSNHLVQSGFEEVRVEI